MWDRDQVDFIRAGLVPWEVIPQGELGGTEGGLKRVLSRSRTTGAETTIVRLTSDIHGRMGSAMDLMCLAGRAVVNGHPFAPGVFVHVPAGAVIDIVAVTTPIIIYAGGFGTATLVEDDAAHDDVPRFDLDALPWTDMSWRGDEAPSADVKIKWLRREEPELGIAFLVAMLPGYQTSVEEVHPVCEESYKLAGDLLLGRRGIVGPGGYFFRPGGVWHAPLYTRTGNMGIIRKSALGSTDYRDTEDGFDIESLKVRAYENFRAPGLEADHS
jgi:hypothetical protein